MVNVSALKPDGEDVTEQWARRVEREAMYVVGRLLGTQPCPFPQCAMMEHQTDFELDNKGRNICPPCMQKAIEALQKKGAKPGFASPALPGQ